MKEAMYMVLEKVYIMLFSVSRSVFDFSVTALFPDLFKQFHLISQKASALRKQRVLINTCSILLT